MKSLYQIEFTKSASKEFKKLPKNIKEKAIEALNFLSQNPRSDFLKTKKMKGPESLYRIRVGDYRLVYEIVNKKLIIIIVKIGHRKDIYRNQ